MSDRETLLQFMETRYDRERLEKLAQTLGMDASHLSSADLRAGVHSLLLYAEREGFASALLSRLERDFADEVPSLEWAGARLGQPAPASASPPVAGGAEMSEAPARLPEPDVSHIQSPLMALRDGVEELEEARRGLELGAHPFPEVNIGPPPAMPEDDSFALEVPDAPAAEEPLFGNALPYRFVHGYTLPEHWARRDAEIAELVTAIRENRYRVLSLVAIGGTGKSALTRKLLDELPRHKVRVDGALWFSFYVEPEFDRFLTEACRYLIPEFDPAAHPSPYEKGVLLREAMEKGHFLLVLDGIEVLLVADRARKDFGAFLDRALREFMEGLCEGSNSQVIVSSRWPLNDLMNKSGYKMLQLADLSPEAAEELLSASGVQGTAEERRLVTARFGSHALTLQVLADYLIRFHEGHPSGLSNIQQFPQEAAQGIKLQAALDGYWQRLHPDERFFLTRMSAFRGGVDERSFLVLNRHGDAYSPEFRDMVRRVIKSPLVSVERRDGRPRLTAHPLIKTFFYERMGDDERDQTHRALKDYSQDLPLPDRPDTLEDYEPLLEACHHCLQVGLHTEAYQIYRRNNMDNALRWWGHYAQASALLEPLREASQGAAPAWQSERWQKSWVENETALIAMLRGDTEQALERFRNSADMDNKSGDGPGESASWQNVASVLTQRGDFWGALKALERSKELEARIGRYEKEDLIAGLEGVCYAELGPPQTALELLSRALAISTQRSSYRAMCYWTWRIGDLYLRVRQVARALANHKEALEIAQREQFRDYEAHTLRGLADVYRMQSDMGQARHYYTDALRVARTLGNPYLETEVRLSQVRLNEAEHDLRDATGHAQQALDRAQESGYQVQATEARLALARCAREENQRDALLAHVREAKRLTQATCHFWTTQELNNLLAREPSLREQLTADAAGSR